MEVWKTIENYPKYEVSNLGRLRSNNYKSKNRILRLTKNNVGYLWTFLYNDEGRKRFYISRLVATAFIENPNNLPTVDHIDQNKLNNCVSNLRWADSSLQNKNRTKTIKGSRVHNSMLNEEQVLEIKKLKKQGKKQREIAELTNCEITLVRSAIYGWKHLG